MAVAGDTALHHKTDTHLRSQEVWRAGPSDDTLRQAPIRADERRLLNSTALAPQGEYTAADPDSPTLEMEPLPPRAPSQSARLSSAPNRAQSESDWQADPFAPTAELDLGAVLGRLPSDIYELYDLPEPSGEPSDLVGSLNPSGPAGTMRAQPRRGRRYNRRPHPGRQRY